MAKKKSKKRKPTRPAGAAAPASARARTDTDTSPSRRAEKREEARRERERRIREARRRQRMRRIARWAIAAGVVTAIVGVVLFVRSQGREQEAAAEEAAQRIGCNEVVTKQEELDAFEALSPEQQHAQPYAQGTGGVPVTAGTHASPLDAEPKVYSQPIQEEGAVHNLEHGYVLVYYSNEGDGALPDDVRSALESVVQSETEVLMAPYEGLANSLALVSWGRLQTCDIPDDAAPGDAETVVRSFIEQYRNSSLAPEPAAG